MAKKLTTAEKIRRYMEAHPDAMPKKIAQELGVNAKYVHVLRSKDKKAKELGTPIRRIKRAYKKAVDVLAEQNPIDSLPKVGDTVGGLTLTREIKGDEFAYRWVRKAPKPETPSADALLKTVDNVNHPAHYKVGGIETIDFIEAKMLGYNLGNVVKYITRADHKGNTYEDLCKARWYLNREISKHLGVKNQ